MANIYEFYDDIENGSAPAFDSDAAYSFLDTHTDPVVRSRASHWAGDIDDSWGFALLNDALPRENLYVNFQLTDSQNNFYSSTLYPVEMQSVPPVDIQLEYNNDALEALTVDTDSFTAFFDENGLRISGPIVYAGDQEIIVDVENLTVNQAAVGDNPIAEIYGAGPNWGLVAVDSQPETQPMSFVIGPDAFDTALEAQTITFDLIAVDAATGEAVATLPATLVVNSAFLTAEEA